MVTSGHDLIHSYADFTQTLIDRFSKRDLELHFRELAHLKQSGSVDSYVSKFQRLLVMVTDVLERNSLFFSNMFQNYEKLTNMFSIFDLFYYYKGEIPKMILSHN